MGASLGVPPPAPRCSLTLRAVEKLVCLEANRRGHSRGLVARSGRAQREPSAIGLPLVWLELGARHVAAALGKLLEQQGRELTVYSSGQMMRARKRSNRCLCIRGMEKVA